MEEHTHPEDPTSGPASHQRRDTTHGGGDPSRHRYAAVDFAARYHKLLEDADGELLNPGDLDGHTLRLTRQDQPDQQA